MVPTFAFSQPYSVVEANLYGAFHGSDALECHQSFPSSFFSGSTSTFLLFIQEETNRKNIYRPSPQGAHGLVRKKEELSAGRSGSYYWGPLWTLRRANSNWGSWGRLHCGRWKEEEDFNRWRKVERPFQVKGLV